MESKEYKDYHEVKDYMGNDEEQLALEDEINQVVAEFEAMETIFFDWSIYIAYSVYFIAYR